MIGPTFSNWIKLLIDNAGVDKKYLKKAIYVSFLSFIGIPFNIFENLKYGRAIHNIKIEYSPIFIIGHWRSGTTYLHNFITQDKNFAFPSVAECFAPESFLSNEKYVKALVRKILPEKRPMDNMYISCDSPHEEEWAITNTFSYTPYNFLRFPKNYKRYREFVFFDNLSPKVQDMWKQKYLKFLKKLTLKYNCKRLVLKNPVNTARIPMLLEIFPDAKFIHIYRNPYVVYASTKNLYKKNTPVFTFHEVDEELENEIEEGFTKIYQQIMGNFFQHKNLIPPQNFVEIKYEDFIGNELDEMKRIYQHLNLPGFEQVKPKFQEFIEQNSNYKTNSYLFDKQMIAKIYNAWKFTIDQWQYAPPN